MISTSNAWKTHVANSSVFEIKATMTGGSTVNLTNADFMQGSVSFTDSISGQNEIKFGSVVSNTFTATLQNSDGRFDTWKWDRITVWFGYNNEWIQRGVYTIDRPSTIGDTVKIECYDDTDKLNKYFGSVTISSYPISCKTVIQNICSACGVTFGDWSSSIPATTLDALTAQAFDSSTTCRQVVSWILETVGAYARMNPTNNKLDFKVWSKGNWGTIADNLNGGVFSTWNTGDVANGGTMQPWSVVTDIDGGFIGDGSYTLERIKNQTIYIDDISVTGVRAYAYQTNDDSDYALAGSGEYVIAIRDNPFVNSNNKDTVASNAMSNGGGITVRPFNASMFGDPSIEAGDVIGLVDRNGTRMVSMITSLTFNLGGDMRVSCDAESPEENANEYADPQTAVVKIANNYTDSQVSDLQSSLESQIDGLIETWAQNTDPASAWTTADLRTLHNGDLWYYTGTSNLTVDGVTIEPSKTYQYNSSTQKWVAYNNPSTSLFDLADGKTKIFYGTTSGTYTDVEVGDYLVDSTSGKTYRYQSATPHWVELTDYKGYADGVGSSTLASAESYTDGAVNTYDTNLNQQKVFNKLTNNGALQGLYMDGGDMYVNASYIKTGNLGASGTITASDLVVQNGSQLGGFNIANNQLEATYTIPHTYTASDRTRVNSIINGDITPTQQDYDLYDVSGDGYIDTYDASIIGKAVIQNNGIISTSITISPTSYTGIVRTDGAKIGANAVVAPEGSFQTVKIYGDTISGFVVSDIKPTGSANAWRKWADGTAECWLALTQNVTSWGAWGNLYEGKPGVSGAYPSNLFIEAPRVYALGSGSNGICGIETYLEGTTTTTPNFYVLRPNAGSNSSFKIFVYAVGKWK